MALLLAGCAVTDSGDGRATAAGPPSPTSTLTVSGPMYRAAIDRVLDCMKDHGYATVGPVLSPIDNRVLLRDVVAKGDSKIFNGRLDTCEKQSGVAALESAYLAQHASVMAPALRPDAAKCLAEQSVTAQGTETDYAAFITAAKNRSDFWKCFSGAVQRRYPKLPPTLTVFY